MDLFLDPFGVTIDNLNSVSICSYSGHAISVFEWLLKGMRAINIF